MAYHQTALKFPETIAPESMRSGEQYLLAVRHSSTARFEVYGPFKIEEKPKRQKEGSTFTHYKARVFMSDEKQRLPREEIVLPLAGHSSLSGKKMSLHVYAPDVKEYFDYCNEHIESSECKESCS